MKKIILAVFAFALVMPAAAFPGAHMAKDLGYNADGPDTEKVANVIEASLKKQAREMNQSRAATIIDAFAKQLETAVKRADEYKKNAKKQGLIKEPLNSNLVMENNLNPAPGAAEFDFADALTLHDALKTQTEAGFDNLSSVLARLFADKALKETKTDSANEHIVLNLVASTPDREAASSLFLNFSFEEIMRDGSVKEIEFPLGEKVYQGVVKAAKALEAFNAAEGPKPINNRARYTEYFKKLSEVLQFND
ncbi:MAG: hypothetical protein LBR90_04275 [Elusimicrobiota bacterium]|jgi:hypothetical protein|nr:hypothetical protein [Elusimicrobiota bacterium]